MLMGIKISNRRPGKEGGFREGQNQNRLGIERHSHGMRLRSEPVVSVMARFHVPSPLNPIFMFGGAPRRMRFHRKRLGSTLLSFFDSPARGVSDQGQRQPVRNLDFRFPLRKI
jgi:hypothetical protein